MPSKVFSAAIRGLDAELVEVEVDVTHGLRSFTIVGLPDKAVEQSKERIEAAIKSVKLSSPHQRTFRILVNLAPADVKKEGSLYDLPIALAFLIASKQTNFNPAGKIFLGELSLDGKLRPIKGALSFAIMAQKLGITEIILPLQNAKEASMIKEIRIIGVQTLGEALAHLENKKQVQPHIFEEKAGEVEEYDNLLSLEHSLEIKLKDVSLALEKVVKGKYGKCEECGKEIEEKRLLAYPEAKLCMKCNK